MLKKKVSFQCVCVCFFFFLLLLPKLHPLHDADIFYPGIEVGSNLAQADGGVAPDRALLVSGLQSCKVTHQLLVQVGLVQFRSQQQHGLREDAKKKTPQLTAGKTATHEHEIFFAFHTSTLTVCSLMAGFVSVKPWTT